MTREPEWDDEQRNRMLGLVEYRRGIHACGVHRSLAFDRANGFTFEIEVCPVCAGAEQFERIMAERDKREREAAGENPHSLSSDGRSIFIRQMSDEEHADRRQKPGGKPSAASPNRVRTGQPKRRLTGMAS